MSDCPACRREWRGVCDAHLDGVMAAIRETLEEVSNESTDRGAGCGGAVRDRDCVGGDRQRVTEVRA